MDLSFWAYPHSNGEKPLKITQIWSLKFKKGKKSRKEGYI